MKQKTDEKFLFLFVAATFLLAAGLSTALAETNAIPAVPYPTDCASGPVNTVTLNYPYGPPGNDSCEICLSVGMLDATQSAGMRYLGEVCGLSNDRIMEMYDVMARVMYCGVVMPSPDRADLGKGYSAPLTVEAVLQDPCV